MSIQYLKIEGISDPNTLQWLLNGSKYYRQFLDMRDKLLKGICPFCPEHFDHLKNGVIKEHGRWRTWVNPYPTAHTEHHFVLAPTQHIEHVDSMTRTDWIDVGGLVSFLTREHGYGIAGGGIVMRFGDPEFHAGSIRHLHANLIVPDGTGEVRIPFYKTQKKREQTIDRVNAFEKLRKHRVTVREAEDIAKHHLTEEELAAVEGKLK